MKNPTKTCTERTEGSCPQCGKEIRLYHMKNGDTRSIHKHANQEQKTIIT